MFGCSAKFLVVRTWDKVNNQWLESSFTDGAWKFYGCPSDNRISICGCPVTFLVVPGARTTKISNAGGYSDHYRNKMIVKSDPEQLYIELVRLKTNTQNEVHGTHTVFTQMLQKWLSSFTTSKNQREDFANLKDLL